MYNYFGPYERDFGDWWSSKDYDGVNPLTRDFLQHLFREDPPITLWHHQEEAILRTIYSYELLQENNLLLNIVTGGGKTAIIAAIIAWLKACHDIHKFLVLCPNTIVRDRLEDDFLDANVFRNFGFFPAGMEHYTNELGLHVMGSGDGPQGILENGIILGNIHQLYQSNISGKRNLAYMMRYVEEIALFNDEAHNTPAAEYDNVLYKLSAKSRCRLDTTATPDRADGKTPDSKMIYEYNINDAQAEVPPIIKRIVVYQPQISSVELTYTNPETGEKRTVDEMDDEFEKIEKGLTSTQWVTDPDPMSKQLQIAINRLEEQKRRADLLAEGAYKPLLFVVAICIKDAEQAQRMLEQDFGLKTLLITEKSDDFDREAARGLGKDDSPYEAVVSVLMLREGWDVPRVGVILLLRKFSSPVYGQQIVGRGLRLNIRDEDLQEICAIIDHEKLDHQWLWDIVDAKVRKEIGQTNIFGDEDLPPKRMKQEIVNPDLLIEIPEPVEKEIADFTELDNIKIEKGEFPDWLLLINEFEYGPDIEITSVVIERIIGKKLDKFGFKEIHDTPDFYNTEGQYAEEDAPELVEYLKNNVRNIADDLLANEGIGSHELGYLYNILIDHVRDKFLNGKSAGTAKREDLIFAYKHLHQINHYFRNIPGLVSSIVRFKKEKTLA